jgi:hypothetical protein
MTRPRAADDFAAIRARMKELQRERAQTSHEVLARAESLQPNAVGRRGTDNKTRRLLPEILRAIARAETT